MTDTRFHLQNDTCTALELVFTDNRIDSQQKKIPRWEFWFEDVKGKMWLCREDVPVQGGVERLGRCGGTGEVLHPPEAGLLVCWTTSVLDH